MAAVSFAPVTEKNLELFRILNVHCLPVRYADKFYADLLKTLPEFTKFAIVNDVVAGGIGCRLEARPDGRQDLYVMTLTVLEPYRRLGVGRSLVQSVLNSLPSHPEIARVYLHVQTSNNIAQAFYSRIGFSSAGIIEGYYKNISPPDAVLLEFPCAAPATA